MKTWNALNKQIVEPISLNTFKNFMKNTGHFSLKYAFKELAWHSFIKCFVWSVDWIVTNGHWLDVVFAECNMRRLVWTTKSSDVWSLSWISCSLSQRICSSLASLFSDIQVRDNDCHFRFLFESNSFNSALFGIGQAFLTESTYTILPHYFDKRLGLASGFMIFGGSALTIILQLVTTESFNALGLNYTFLIFMGLTFVSILAASCFKRILKSESREQDSIRVRIKSSFSTKVLKRPEFWIWTISSCFAEFGAHVGMITIVSFVHSILRKRLTLKFA